MRQKFHGPDEGLGSSIAILVGSLGAFALTFGFIAYLMVRGDHYPNPGMAAYTPPPGTVLIPPISGKPLPTEDLPVASANQPKRAVATDGFASEARATDEARTTDRYASPLRKLSVERAPDRPALQRQARSGTARLFDRMSAPN